MARQTKAEMLEKIRTNIEQSGHHVYLIMGGQCPRYLYTIGLSPRTTGELLLAGATGYQNDDAKRIIGFLAEQDNDNLVDGASFDIDSLGTFSLRKADSSWSALFVLGALDYFQCANVAVLQVVPDHDHWTIDIPDLSKPRSTGIDPVWQWLTEPWQFPVSNKSVAITNLDALRGSTVTEAMRWEEDQWELFAGQGPEVAADEIRQVPLGTLLGVDPTLSPVIDLEVGKGVWRKATDFVWNQWESK